jgi:hypothetical protein
MRLGVQEVGRRFTVTGFCGRAIDRNYVIVCNFDPRWADGDNGNLAAAFVSA